MGEEPAGAVSGPGCLREEGEPQSVVTQRLALAWPGGPLFLRGESRVGKSRTVRKPFFLRPGTVSWASVSSDRTPASAGHRAHSLYCVSKSNTCTQTYMHPDVQLESYSQDQKCSGSAITTMSPNQSRPVASNALLCKHKGLGHTHWAPQRR